MKAVGIIAEYNPLHTGHAYHIEKSRRLTGADAVVCVMSGNFVQRGELAIMNKWARAKSAILCGADLVVELPFCFAAQSAEFFAKGAVCILSALGCVDYLSFGSELGDISPLETIANAILEEKKDVSENIKNALSTGMSYPAARQKGMGELGGLLEHPNNILAVEYLKAIKRFNSHIKPITVKRQGAGYNEVVPVGGFISATKARQLIFEGNFEELKAYLPVQCYEILQNEIKAGLAPINTSMLDQYITALLRIADIKDIQNTAYCGEGLENRIHRISMQNYGFEEIVQGIKTKRYPLTRLQRLLINFAVGLDNESLDKFVSSDPQYIRVLGANEIGRKLLANARKISELPIITKVADYKKKGGGLLAEMMELEFKATDLYSLCYADVKQRRGGWDLIHGAVMV